MNRYQIFACVLPFSLALACGDGSGLGEGQGGTPNSSNNGGSSNQNNAGSANAGSAGSESIGGGFSGNGGSSGGSGQGEAGAGGSFNGGAGSGSGTATPQDICQRGCAKTEPLNCPNDPPDCEADCLAIYLDTPAECQALVLTYGDCAADRPTSDFECDEEGEAVPSDGVCEAESLAVFNCLLTQLP